MALTHCKRGCWHEHTESCLAQREIVYLGQVGALDHLNDLALKAGVEPAVEAVEYERHGGATGRKSAYPYYEAALEAASAALEGGQLALGDAASTVRPAQEEAKRTRAALRSKQTPQPVPGRHHWLQEVA